MATVSKALSLRTKDLEQIKKAIRSGKTEQRVVFRARIVLLASQGESNYEIARRIGITRSTVAIWRKRYTKEGFAGLLYDRPRGKSFKPIASKKKREVIRATLHEKPAQMTHWSCRSMAKKLDVSKATVQRIWNANGLKPHLIKTFKLSNDANFTEKLEDVVGLYMNPPENALVLCIDEKSQIQALDRTQPSLPLKKGRAASMTHDYKRNGTTTLFAALDVLKGQVIGQCMRRHRHQEFLRFLKIIDQNTPKYQQLHCIVDNYSTHKKQEVRDWLEKHPRFHFHFIPTSSSWLNLVERWFAQITTKRIRRGVFKSVTDLENSIYDFIEHNNKNPKPFIWSKSANKIIKKVFRGKAMLETLH